MPYCEVEGCKKTNLRPDEVVYHAGTNLIVCEECSAGYENVVSLFNRAPSEDFKEPVGYNIELSDKGGLAASVRIGESVISISSPAEDIRKLFR